MYVIKGSQSKRHKKWDGSKGSKLAIHKSKRKKVEVRNNEVIERRREEKQWKLGRH
jgi:hypothetical protein